MGDHRASIKIQMEFHGIEDKTDMWINWSDSSSECHGVDQRIIDWFRSVHERGMEAYNDALFESQRESRERETRERELAELKRLQDKYQLSASAPPPTP